MAALARAARAPTCILGAYRTPAQAREQATGAGSARALLTAPARLLSPTMPACARGPWHGSRSSPVVPRPRVAAFTREP